MNTLISNPDIKSESEKKPVRFQTLIFRRLFFAALGLALITAFVYSYLTAMVVKDFYSQEGAQAAENFAHLSELALLYESGENSRDAATATLNFPSIKHVAIIDTEGKIIFDEGNTSDEIFSSLRKSDWSEKAASIFSTSSSTWQIAAPVFTIYNDIADDELILNEEPNDEVYLGYVAVQVDAATVRNMQYQNFVGIYLSAWFTALFLR